MTERPPRLWQQVASEDQTLYEGIPPHLRAIVQSFIAEGLEIPARQTWTRRRCSTSAWSSGCRFLTRVPL